MYVSSHSRLQILSQKLNLQDCKEIFHLQENSLTIASQT